jgi:hypothetical protein
VGDASITCHSRRPSRFPEARPLIHQVPAGVNPRGNPACFLVSSTVLWRVMESGWAAMTTASRDSKLRFRLALVRSCPQRSAQQPHESFSMNVRGLYEVRCLVRINQPVSPTFIRPNRWPRRHLPPALGPQSYLLTLPTGPQWSARLHPLFPLTPKSLCYPDLQAALEGSGRRQAFPERLRDENLSARLGHLRYGWKAP